MFNMTQKSYALLSSVKNEENNIKELIECIFNQTIKPKLWIFINDNSNDNTQRIILEMRNKYIDSIPIIYLHNTETNPNRWEHLSFILTIGYKYLLTLKEYNDINYIGILDADDRVPTNYYEFLISQMEIDPSLGITSGSLNNSIGYSIDQPLGGVRLIRKKCLEQIHFPIVKNNGFDTMQNIYSLLNGWKNRTYTQIKVETIRPTFSRDGMKSNFINIGKSYYYFRYHPIIIIFKFFQYSKLYSFNLSKNFLIAYLTSMMNKDSQFPDKRIKKIFGFRRIFQIINSFNNRDI